MASGNSSGLGATLFRGALHGNSSSTNAISGNSTTNNQQQHQHLHSTGHPLQQGGVAGNSHIHHPQQPSSQHQPTVGSSNFSKEESSRGRGTPGSPDHMSTVMSKLWFDHTVESSLSSLKKEEHEKRTKDLRKQLEYITDTNWKYSPVEKYIGQQ